MASLMIDFVRPCIHGLLILMTIYYYPPPVFFLMEFILKFFDMEIALIVFDTIRCYPFFKFARRARRKVQLYPHTVARLQWKQGKIKWGNNGKKREKVVEIVDFTGIGGCSLHIFHVKLKNLSYLRTQPRRGKSCGNRGNCTNSSIVSTSTTLRCRLCPSFDDSKFRPLTCPKNNKRKTTSHPTSSHKVTGLTAQQQLSARRSGSIEAC